MPRGTTIDDEPYIMMSDAHDVICNNGPESVFAAMDTHYKDARVVFSPDLYQFPCTCGLASACVCVRACLRAIACACVRVHVRLRVCPRSPLHD